MRSGAVKSPWYGALIAAGALAVVSVVALVQGWGFGSWVWAAAVCAVGGVSAALTQAGRNRRLDLAAEQAQAANQAQAAR